MHVRSFDVFDTVLTRAYAVPSDLFVELGQRVVNVGRVSCSAEQFARLRMDAEVAARRLVPGGEVTLDEIYVEMAGRFAWPLEVADHIKETELVLEETSLQAIPGVAAQVDAERPVSGAIWFISDMYLPSRFIERVLRREGLFRDGDKLVVSGEQRASKHAGALFVKLRQQAAESIESWVHWGDNPHADVAMPRSMGIDGRLVSKGLLSSREWQFRGKGRIAPLWRSQVAASLRMARLEAPALDAHQQAIWDSATNVSGPLLFAFVWWCLREAKTAGIHRLYFVSRDGQILHRLAQSILEKLAVEIEVRYLYGSRQAWHLAGICRLDEPEVRMWLYQGGAALSLDRILGRLGFKTDHFADSLEAAGFDPESRGRPLVPNELARVDRWLVSGPVSDEIIRAAEERRRLLRGYLSQEQVFDGTPWAIVDVGWHGNMQLSLGRALRALGCDCSLTGFYFGLFRARPHSGEHTMRAFWNEMLNCPYPSELSCMAELFMAADHGSVFGYREKDGTVVPVMNRPVNKEALDWGLTTHQEAVLVAGRHLSARGELLATVFDEFAKAALRGFADFHSAPSPTEAPVWGAFEYSSDQTESTFCQMIPPMTPWQAAKAAWVGSSRPEGWWIAGYNALNSSPLVSLFLSLRNIKRVVAMWVKWLRS